MTSTYVGPPVQGELLPGKRTIIEQTFGFTGGPQDASPGIDSSTPGDQGFGASVQRRATTAGPSPASVHEAAVQGVATPSSTLPYASRISRLFGQHEVSSIQAHQGPEAAASAQAMGAQAYATGNHVVLGGSADLHTVAHEAAHVVQQRGGVQLKGGVGEAGDAYERHADAVADAVVAGQSAEALLDAGSASGGPQQAAVQRSPAPSGPQASHTQPGAPPSVKHYSDMLAAVQAAKALSDHAKPGDPHVRAQILALIEPVERRLGELNDHQGRLAQFGAGNVAGQSALDTSEAAIRSWRQLLLLGAMVRTDELVLRFRMGAEVLQFLTGEQRDAPTLRELNRVSGLVGMGAAAAVLTPALVALAAAEAPLLAFAGRLAAQRVALWAAVHPAAALAASEVLLGFGLQIGEGGWENFWAQLHDPQGRWFVLAQVLMDYMHVRGTMGGHDAAPTASPRRSAPVGAEADVEAARQQLAKARAALRQVHDAAASSEQVNHGGNPAEGESASATHTGTTAAATEAEVTGSSHAKPPATARDPATAGAVAPKEVRNGEPAVTKLGRTVASLPVELLEQSHTLRIVERGNGEFSLVLCSDCRFVRGEIDAALAEMSAKGPTRSLRVRLERLRAKVVELEAQMASGETKQTEGITRLAQVTAHLTDLSKKFPSANRLCVFCSFKGQLDYDLMANNLGFERTGARSHGQPVYRRGNEFISPDVDRHNGGIWKKATGDAANLRNKALRDGTFSEDLTELVGP
jgi:Novel toxin 21/Domain of unknown function (DUF4157)